MVKIATGSNSRRCRDWLVLEEPFTLMYRTSDGLVSNFGSTMRTPGEDLELSWGMMFSEGLVRCRVELNRMSFCSGGGPNELNRLVAELRLSQQDCATRLQHRPAHGLPQSACGLCGSEELQSRENLLNWALRQRPTTVEPSPLDGSLLAEMSERLKSQMPLFARTGASHGCLIVDPEFKTLSSAEDVGRHNACDKAIGKLIMQSQKADIPFSLPPGSGLFLSSRLSFELAAKALRVGASWVGSVGAPTELAAELLQRANIEAFGFVSETRYNRY